MNSVDLIEDQIKILDTRGMKLTGSNKDGVRFQGEGVYGNVFFSEQKGRVVKVYLKEGEHANIFKTSLDKVFEMEKSALVLANKTPELARFVPAYYGEVKVSEVIDKNGQDISYKFHLDMAFEMEFIDGKSIKQPNSESSKLRELFAQYGIYGTDDMDCFYGPEGTIVKVVDITMKEYVLWDTGRVEVESKHY